MKNEIHKIGQMMDASPDMIAFAFRHNIRAAPYLTVIDDDTAARIAEYLRPQIEGKTVVEIGGGIGLLSLHMGLIAKRVYCIEANPMWSWIFAAKLLKRKPRNVSFLLGAADEFIGGIKGDVAVYCTHSDVEGMRLLAGQFAPLTIDFYGRLIAESKPGTFDKTWVDLRSMA